MQFNNWFLCLFYAVYPEAVPFETAAELHRLGLPTEFYATLPRCGILNNIKYHHNLNNDVEMSFTMRLNVSKCLAFRLPVFGLFFLLWKVNPGVNNTSILSCWVQTGIQCYHPQTFRFSLVLTLPNSTLTYTDSVSFILFVWAFFFFFICSFWSNSWRFS